MKRNMKLFSFIALSAVIGFSMLACASMPTGTEESMLAPNASNAVVYFLKPTMMSGGGEKPQGNR